RRQAGLQIHPHHLDMRRSAERNWRLAGKSDLEEVTNHWCGDIATRLAMSHGRRIVETHINADDEVGGEADEPAILLVVSSTGLARDRSVEHFELLRRAAFDNSFHDVGHLVSRHRIDDLRAIIDELRLLLTGPFSCITIGAFAIIVLPNGAAVAVL